MATSFAMALGILLDELIRVIGHDGSEMICPANGPGGRRGFHSQECVSVAFALGFAATEIELFPSSQFLDQKKIIHFPAAATNLDGNWERFNQHVQASRGIIAGLTKRSVGHAVAYENGLVLDPRGFTYHFSRKVCEQHDLYCQYLLRLDRIAQ